MVKITHLDARSESLDVRNLPFLQNHIEVLAHLGTNLGKSKAQMSMAATLEPLVSWVWMWSGMFGWRL